MTCFEHQINILLVINIKGHNNEILCPFDTVRYQMLILSFYINFFIHFILYYIAYEDIMQVSNIKSETI